MELEIPPEAVDALANDLAGRLIASGIDRHYAAYAGLLKAMPHLLEWFAERLTSDEVVEVLARSLHREDVAEHEVDYDFNRYHYRADADRHLRAVAAVLVPGREDGAYETLTKRATASAPSVSQQGTGERDELDALRDALLWREGGLPADSPLRRGVEQLRRDLGRTHEPLTQFRATWNSVVGLVLASVPFSRQKEGGHGEGELPADALLKLVRERVLDELAAAGWDRDDVDTEHLAERLIGVAHNVFPLPETERCRALAQALVDVREEIDFSEDTPDDEVVLGIERAHYRIQNSLPPGTLEGWAEEGSDA